MNVKIRAFLANNEMLTPRLIEAASEGEANFDEYIATLECLTKKLAEGEIGGFIVQKAWNYE